ncbi:unnamed protein product [Effrenium voratum]|nr:unnamed protein product [Effrenium voratum]
MWSFAPHAAKSTALADKLLFPSELRARAAQEGLWSSRARQALKDDQAAVHWFDGMFLACTLVANAKLQDPVNMRQLTAGDAGRLPFRAPAPAGPCC